MALHQYIGARYVPKFYENSSNTSEWRSGVIYEPLTIVTYNGNSYTSKRQVTADIGNPSDNPSYWVATGAYNDQVEQYRQEVAAYQEEVEEYKDKVRAFTDWADRKLLFVADSYDNVASVGSNISDLCADYLGCSYDRASAGGYGLTGEFTGGTKKWIDLVSAVGNKDTFTDVVIFGGLNDMTASWDDVIAAARALDTYIKTNFPNVGTIYCGFLGWIYGNLNTRNYAKTTYEYYNALIPQLGWKNLNNFAFVARDPSYFDNPTDQDHPGVTHVNVFARMLAECLLTGSCEHYHKYSMAVAFNETYFQAATANMTVDIHNNMCSLYLGGVAGRKYLVATLNTDDNIQFIEGVSQAIPFNDDLRFFLPALNPTSYDTLPFVLRQSHGRTLSIIPMVAYTASALYLQPETFTFSL